LHDLLVEATGPAGWLCSESQGNKSQDNNSQESVLSAMTSSAYSTAGERLLLREITHRVNNEFASAIQVVSFAAAKSCDRNVKAALVDVIEQLHNYARVHHALQMPASNDCIDASAYLRELCRSISRSKLEKRSIELVLVERLFWMTSERCWLMGMIVAELITNAVRHAFDRQGGTIRIECRTSGQLVECRVSDNGSASAADVRPGSGLRIIEALAQALGADFRFDLGAHGSESVLTFPVDVDSCEEPKVVRSAADNAAHAF
jgi:two-component sensor histidine kinase